MYCRLFLCITARRIFNTLLELKRVNMKTRKNTSHSPILRRAAVLLVALAWSSLAFGGEIHDAAQNGDMEKVKALLKGNPDLVFSKNDNYGCTPLHLAVFSGHKEVVELLLTNKADVNAKSTNGLTPLHVAAVQGYKEVAELLLASKADVKAKDNYGKMPLH